MQKKFIVIIGITLLCSYLIGTYIYFSTKPHSIYYCPIEMPDQQPIDLNDPVDPTHRYQIINDVSCLNETRVYEIITIKTTADIKKALEKAQQKNLHISIAGVRHSMGGQAFYKDALVLDMTNFNRIISLDEINKVIMVESGATWHQIQLFLHQKNLAVKAMQSTDIFTVGGSVSVNAHGMDPHAGSISSTIQSMSVMLADGTIQNVSRNEHAELFNAIIGGYGLFGIILQIELEVTDNSWYEQEIIYSHYEKFPEFFEQNKKKYELLYAHLSTSPLSFFNDLIIYAYKKIDLKKPFNPLQKISMINARRFLLNLSKKRYCGQIFKWIAEKYIDPYLMNKFDKNIISRNEVMHDSVEYLENVLAHETDILHEYFIPRNNFVACLEQIRDILKKSPLTVLNASIRVVNKESNLLNYAPEDMFALVLYINQPVNQKALDAMKTLTRQLIDTVLSFNGTFFLPYQLNFSKEQLHKAYPIIDRFFELKRKYDPQLLFMNNFYAHYAQ